MNQFPLEFSIRQRQGNRKRHVVCDGLLRFVPGKRHVYTGTCDGMNVVLKVFSARQGAWLYQRREWKRLCLLHSKGLNAPEPLFHGKTADGDLAVATRRIEASATALEVYNRIADQAQKHRLMLEICEELAKQHDKGVLQSDPHLQNFLVQNDEIFALDVGQMRFPWRRVSRRKGLRQIAALICYIDQDDPSFIETLCRKYTAVRGWQPSKSDTDILTGHFRRHMKTAVRAGLSKCIRTSTRHIRISAGGTTAIFDRSFCNGAEPLDLVRNIDSLMEDGEILKNGKSCYVSRIRWNGFDAVVKRYNHLGLVHSLRHTIKGSRAKRSWLHGHRLLMLNIATPRPLAFIDRYIGPILHSSYLVTRYADGQTLYHAIQNSPADKSQRLLHAVQLLLDKMDRNALVHSDLKYTNFIITGGGAMVMDLDAVYVRRWPLFSRARRGRMASFSAAGCRR